MSYRVNIYSFFIYLQTSPRTIWQERSHRTIVPITRLLNMSNIGQRMTSQLQKTLLLVWKMQFELCKVYRTLYHRLTEKQFWKWPGISSWCLREISSQLKPRERNSNNLYVKFWPSNLPILQQRNFFLSWFLLLILRLITMLKLRSLWSWCWEEIVELKIKLLKLTGKQCWHWDRFVELGIKLLVLIQIFIVEFCYNLATISGGGE